MIGNYPLGGVLWTLLVLFLWVIWFWILITVFADLFRRHDISGWMKALWMIFVIVLPYLGVFVYLVSQSRGMTQRNVETQQAAQARFDTEVRRAAAGGSAADQIAQAKQLLDNGAISQEEYDALKRRTLGLA
jgi:hypothetical protein